MKKRLLALLLSCALLLALAGCVVKTTPEGPVEPSKPALESPVESAEPTPIDYTPAENLEEGQAEFMFRVVHSNGFELITYITTEAETLGEALLDNGLIAGEESAYGLYVKTVDEETVDDSQEQWWRLTKDGEAVNTGVDSTPVEHGAIYEFTFTQGY